MTEERLGDSTVLPTKVRLDKLDLDGKWWKDREEVTRSQEAERVAWEDGEANDGSSNNRDCEVRMGS